MTPGDAGAVAAEALTLALAMGGPLLVTALVVGLAVGLLQALTQIQEMTLAFVPKLFAMGVVLMLSLPMMGAAAGGFMARIVDRIAQP